MLVWPYQYQRVVLIFVRRRCVIDVNDGQWHFTLGKRGAERRDVHTACAKTQQSEVRPEIVIQGRVRKRATSVARARRAQTTRHSD